LSEIIQPELEQALKNHKEQMNVHYAQLIANPYKAQNLIDDIRREVISTAATLMENRIPLSVPSKKRELTDVLQEAAAEAGMMMGSNAMAAGVSFFRNVKEKVQQDAQDRQKPIEEIEIVVYEDEDGNFFFIDPDTDEEVDCDQFGNPLEE
tara:strand:- start:2949 stop:3401 length:453 start_codon:yes stop_codon:yes gene_type:complete